MVYEIYPPRFWQAPILLRLSTKSKKILTPSIDSVMYNLPKYCQCFWLSIHPTIKFKRVLEGQSTHKSRQHTGKHATRTRVGRMKHLRSVRQACKLVFRPLHAEVHYSTRSNCVLGGNWTARSEMRNEVRTKIIQCWILLTSSSQAGLRV